MVGERQRATERGYDDPIQPDINKTHENYHACLTSILDVRISTLPFSLLKNSAVLIFECVLGVT